MRSKIYKLAYIMLLFSVVFSCSQENPSELQKSCDRKDANSCYALASIYYKKVGGQFGYEKAAELFQKACDLGNSKGCYSTAVMYYKGIGVPQDYQKALTLFNKACDLGFQKSCKEARNLKIKCNLEGFPDCYNLKTK